MLPPHEVNMCALEPLAGARRHLLPQGRTKLTHGRVFAHGMGESLVIELHGAHPLAQNKGFECLLPALPYIGERHLLYEKTKTHLHSISKCRPVLVGEFKLLKQAGY